MKITFLTFTLLMSMVVNTNSNEVDLSDAYFQFGWKNLENPSSSLIDIPNANATLEILKSEIYLDQKENIKKKKEYLSGTEINIEDIEEDLIIEDREGFYNIEITYNNSGYIKSDSFTNFTSQDFIRTLNNNKRDDVSKLTWITEPQIFEGKVGFSGYKVDWKDGAISYEFEGIVLGRYGYISVIGQFFGDGDESDELIDYWKNVVFEISNTVKFNEGHSYNDFILNDRVAVYDFSNIIDGSYGFEGATNRTVYEAYCLITKSDLIKARINQDDYPRFLGKEIVFILSNVNEKIYDSSGDDGPSVITGIYGDNNSVKFEKIKTRIKDNFEITYTNTNKVSGDKEGEILNYDYKNKLIFKKGKPTLFFAKVDQTGFSINKWNFSINCRDNPYTEEEKKLAKGSPLQSNNSLINTPGKPEWFDPLVNKILNEKKVKENSSIPKISVER